MLCFNSLPTFLPVSCHDNKGLCDLGVALGCLCGCGIEGCYTAAFIIQTRICHALNNLQMPESLQEIVIV